MEINEEQKAELQQCGSVGFTYREIAINFGWPIGEVMQQFSEENGEIYFNYMRGRLQAELDIRKTVLEGARNGSTPMIEKMIAFFKAADMEHRELGNGINLERI